MPFHLVQWLPWGHRLWRTNRSLIRSWSCRTVSLTKWPSISSPKETKPRWCLRHKAYRAMVSNRHKMQKAPSNSSSSSSKDLALIAHLRWLLDKARQTGSKTGICHIMRQIWQITLSLEWRVKWLNSSDNTEMQRMEERHKKLSSTRDCTCDRKLIPKLRAQVRRQEA